MRTGLLLLLIGAWVVTRSVIKDDHGHTLIDRLLGLNPSSSSKSGSSSSVTSPGNVLSQGGKGAAVGSGITSGESVGQALNQAGVSSTGVVGAGIDAGASAFDELFGPTRVAPHYPPGTPLTNPQLRRLFTLPPPPSWLNRTSRSG